MTDYTPQANFRRKDNLPTGHADKEITGAELQAEFSAIATAITSKADTTDLPVGVPVTTTAPFTLAVGYGNTATVLPPGATVTPTADTSNFFTLTFASSTVTIAAPTNPKSGQVIRLKLVNGIGASTFTWNAVFKWRGSESVQPTQVLNAIDIMESVYDGTYWLTRYVGKNYS